MREVRGFEPWEKQQQIARSLVTNRRTLAYTCNGAGKSTLFAEMVLWFMSTRRNARVISTAGNFAQVLALWRKIRSAHAESRRALPGRPLQVKWDLSPEWFSVGLSTDAEESMQGYHSWTGKPDQPQNPGDDGGLLAIVDEASGVKPFVFNAMRGYMTTPNTYWLVGGNPNASGTEFHRMSLLSQWDRFQISAFDVPEHIISREWIDEQRADFGEDSPQWQVRVLGQFPDSGGDWSLVTHSMLDGCKDLRPNDNSGVHIGVDIARMGADYTVMVLVDNGRMRSLKSWKDADLMDTSSRIWRQVQAWQKELRRESGRSDLVIPAASVHVEMDGIGSGVVDRLREAGYRVDPVLMGGNPSSLYRDLVGSRTSFRNRRAELHWVCRRLLETGKLAIPEKYDQVWRDLSQIRYEIDDRGTVLIESKEKIRSRYGRSPDYSDALILALNRSRAPGVRVARL